ncbi:hypothetical protein ABZX92_27605 [Lentzea sp. NPDC006480]|uniref:hypothetical protein n=1 Tax=Lentzea sp. NPDC006480 TaxID=3157176 RepID=UPI0033B0F38A
MAAHRLRSAYTALATAVVVSLPITACDDPPSPTTTAAPPPPGTSVAAPADPLPPLNLSQFWIQSPGCTAFEQDIRPQPADVANLVKVCKRSNTNLRLVNISPTSVRLTYSSILTTVTYEKGLHLTDGPITKLILEQAGADALEVPGQWLLLPSGDSAVVTLAAATVQLPTVAADAPHGTKAFNARTLGSLIEQLPWDQIGKLNGVTAKAVACVGGAAAAAEKQDALFDAYVNVAPDCFSMVEEITKAWNERATRPPSNSVLRSGISKAAAGGTEIATKIKRIPPALLHFRF